MESPDIVQSDTQTENALLINEVHEMEDRIDITSMEIEDLEDYCRKTEEEINSLHSRLDGRSDIIAARDVRMEVSASFNPEEALEAAVPEEKKDDAGASEEASGKTEEEKAPDEKKIKRMKNTGALDYQPDISALQSDSRWEVTMGENVLEPHAPAEEDDKRKPGYDRKKRRGRRKKAEASGETDASAEEELSGDASPDMKEKEREAGRKIRGWFGKRKKDMVYCPGCGAFVGENIYCPECGSRVK